MTAFIPNSYVCESSRYLIAAVPLTFAPAMKKLNSFFILTLVSTPLWLFAQQLVFSEKHTGQLISQLFIEMKCLDSGQVYFFETDHEGTVDFPINGYDFILTASHLNYNYFVDTISKTNTFIKLTPASYKLNEVVVTGQYQPQSASRSVYVVRSIDHQEIGAYAARDLNDLLFHQLNFRSFNDIRQGKSSYSLQGISGNNLLVLLDGIPINGRTSDDFDFSHIAIDNIEKVEIIEGPMSVLYGSNAMAGVVNIISRSKVRRGWSVGAAVHEESAGSEFGWNRGIHNFAMNSSYGFKNFPLLFTAGLSRNLFHGYRGNVTKRAMLWKPKDNRQAYVGIDYRPNLWHFRFRLNFLDEVIDAPGEPIGIIRPVALDDRFHTKRYLYQLSVGRSLENFGRLESIFAVTDYQREKSQMAINLSSGNAQPSTAAGANDFTTLLNLQNRSVLNYLAGESLSTQIGYNLEYEKIEGGRLIDEKSRSVYEMAFFGSLEFQHSSGLKVRPGIRYTYNQIHPAPFIPSLNIKYIGFSGFDIRFAYGRGFRAPSLREMYFEFFDSNHRVIGNQNLKAEKGHHFSFNFSSDTERLTQAKFSWALDLFYNYIYDQITYGRSIQNPLNTTLINQSLFESIGFRLELAYKYKGLELSPSFSYTGRNNVLSKDFENPGFLYSPEAALNVRFSPIKSPWNFAINYKFYGEQPVYATDIEDVLQEFQLSSIDAYHWMDFNVSRKIVDRFTVSTGMRNILNVKDINSTPALGSIHPSGDSEYISYGRSLFLKLNFSIN